VAYRAEIEIGVKGASQLKQLQERIKDLAFRAEALQLITNNLYSSKAVQNVRNYAGALNEAKSALDAVEIATKDESNAVREYVTALGEANAASARQNKLIEEEITLRNKAKQGLQTQRRREEYLAGPGRTAPTEKLAQRSIKEAGEREARFEARKTFAEEIFNIEKNFDKKLRDTAIDNLLERFQLEENLQKRSIDKLLQAGKAEGEDFDRRLAQQTTDRLSANKKVNSARVRQRAAIYRLEQRRLKQTTRERLRAEEAVSKKRKDALGSAIIGGAFPLLFGQGIGAAAGGGVGGAAGGLVGGQFGFGLSLVGTTLGTAADTFAKNMASLASSLSKPKEALEALEEAGIKVDDSLKANVDSLLDAGQAYEAQQLVLQEIADTLGPQAVSQLAAYDQETKKLEQSYQDAYTALVRELLPAMLGFITQINNLIKVIDNLPPWLKNLGGGLSRASEFATPIGGARTAFESFQLLGEQRAKGVTPDVTKPSPEALEAKRKKALEGIQTDAQLDVIEKQNAALEAGNSLLNEGAYIAARQVIFAQTRLAVAQAEGDTNKIKVALAREALELDRLRLRQVKELNRAEKDGAREAERAARLAEQALQKELKVRTALISEDLKQSDISYKLNALELGKAAAIDDQLAGLDKRKAQERTQIALSTEDVRLQEAKLLTLELQYDLKRRQLEADAERIALERELAKLAGERETEDIGIGLRRQIDAVERRISSPFGDQDSEMLELRIKQLEKQEDIYNDLDRKIEDVEIRLKKDPGNKDLEQQLGLLTERRLKYEELLPVLDQVQQKELKLQQTLQQLQPLTNALSQGLTDLFTGLVDGSKDAQEVFADMLKNMGQALIQQGAVMIAQYIAIGIAKAFAFGGLSGGGGQKELNIADIQQYSGIGADTRVTPFAEGGYVTRPTNALIGEGSEPEYVLPASKMPEALERYSAGVRGSAVIPSNGDSGGMAGASGGGGTIVNYNGPTLNFNSEDYVPASAVPGIIDEATKRGAKAGEARTFATLRNSRSQRGRIGLGR
jgi:hypothetical protein